MPVSIPKKPKFQGVNNTAVSFGEPEIRRSSVGEAQVVPPATNGGQPPAEEMPVNFRGEPVSAEQANPENGRVEPGTLQVDDFMAAGGLGKLAASLLSKGTKVAAEKMLPRLGAEGMTVLREMQSAVKAGHAAPEELAQLAQRLLGKETPEVARRPAWEAADRVAKAPYRGPPLNSEVTYGAKAGPGDFSGGAKSAPVLAKDAERWAAGTNAGARTGGQVPMTKVPAPVQSPVVDQFVAQGQDWLSREFPQAVTQMMKKPPGVM